MTLMDSAMGLAFVTTLDEPVGWTTLEVKANFTARSRSTPASFAAPGRSSIRVAGSRPRRRGSRTRGPALAHGTSTILIL